MSTTPTATTGDKEDTSQSSRSTKSGVQKLSQDKPAKRQRVLGAAWLKPGEVQVVDPINFVSLAPENFPDVLDEEILFEKLCQFMRIDPFDDSKKIADIWNRRQNFRPSASAPRFSSSFLLADMIPPVASISSTIPSSSSSSAASLAASALLSVPIVPTFTSIPSRISTISPAPTSVPRFPPLSAIYPKDDPRRKMATACMKAANTMGDREVFQKMLRRYFTKNVEWENRYIGNKNPYGPNSVKLNGIEAVVRYYDRVSYIVPDMLNHLQASDVILRPDGSAIIVVQFVSIGTKIFRSKTESFERVIVNSEGQVMGIPLSAESERQSVTTSNSSNHMQEGQDSAAAMVSGAEDNTVADGGDPEVMDEDTDITMDDLEADMASRFQQVSICDIELIPDDESLQMSNLNMSVSYAYPFHNAPSPEDAGKIYKTTLLHTVAVQR